MLALRSRVGTRPSRVLLGGSLFVSPAAYFICKPVLRADEGGGRPALLAPPREEAFCARAGSDVPQRRPPWATTGCRSPRARGSFLPLSPLSRDCVRGARGSPPPSDPTAQSHRQTLSRVFFFVFGKIVVPETHNQGGREESNTELLLEGGQAPLERSIERRSRVAKMSPSPLGRVERSATFAFCPKACANTGKQTPPPPGVSASPTNPTPPPARAPSSSRS